MPTYLEEPTKLLTVQSCAKLTGHSYACNSSKIFENEAYAMIGNGNQ